MMDARRIHVQYYAVLREQAGKGHEEITTGAATAADLYSELQSRYRFHLARGQLKVAVNTEFTDWSRRLNEGDVVVFIPPMAGG
jgi:molybdopterin converting factor subunit 1